MRFSKLISAVILVPTFVVSVQAQNRGRDDHRDRDYRSDRDRDHHDSRVQPNDYRDNHNSFRRDAPPPEFQSIPRHWDEPRAGASVHIAYRSGYYGYGLNWADRAFRFRFYVFDYPKANPAFSPWYYYPQLPAYVDSRKVSFNIPNLRIDVGQRESYDRRNDRLDRDLSNAVLDLTDAVEKGDTHLIGQLVPQGYSVVVDPPVGRSYQMNSDDFYSLFSDMATITRTQNFDVTEVQEGRDWAQVYARQDFDDPWGRRTTEFFRITLEYAKNGFRIAEVSTSQRSL